MKYIRARCVHYAKKDQKDCVKDGANKVKGEAMPPLTTALVLIFVKPLIPASARSPSSLVQHAALPSVVETSSPSLPPIDQPL